MNEKIEERIVIDWIAITDKTNSPFNFLLSFFNLPFEEFTELKSGLLGYKKQAIFKNIKLLWEGSEGMGIHLIISGKGCRYLEAKGIDLFKKCFKLKDLEKINITRLDIALDTSFNILDKVESSIRNGLYVSKSRTIKLFEKVQEDKTVETETIYVGSRQSNFLIRFYNKAKEQKKDNLDWWRVELEIKKEYVKRVLKEFEKSISKTFFNLLGTYFRPIAKRAKNISRSPTADYWQEFCKLEKRIKLYQAPEQSELSDKLNWLINQCSRTMGVLSVAFDNTEWIRAVAENGIEKVTQEDLEMIERWKKGAGNE